MVASALIGAGASLLGGLFNRSAQNKANERNRPVNQVKEWEEAGINPLFGISSGGYIPHQANTAIGDSVATAGGIYAEHLRGNKEQELRETQIELENELLKKELDKLAKPVEPSHMERYGKVLPLPSSVGGFNERTAEVNDLYRDSASAGPSPFPSHADDIGLPKRDVYNLYVDVYDSQTDRWVTIPNPDLMDAGPLESTYAMAQIGAADFIQNALEAGGVGGQTFGDQMVRPKYRPRADMAKPPKTSSKSRKDSRGKRRNH